MARLRSDGGATLTELAFVSMLLMGTLAIVGTIVYAALRTSRFAETESASMDGARQAAAQIQRDIRNAVNVDAKTCTPAAYCLRLYVQSPNGAIDQIQYRSQQASPPSGPTTLYRDSSCAADFSTCTYTRTIATNLVNQAKGSALFTCVNSTTYPRIDTMLLITPLSSTNSGTLTLQSSGRPRSVGTAFC